MKERGVMGKNIIKNTIIFDLDGTLLNTLGDLHRGFNYALKMCSYQEFNIEEVKNFVGNGINKAFERAIKKDENSFEVKQLVDIFKEYYINHLYELTKPYDGILNMLDTLKKKGYSLGVVSNKYDSAVKELCKKYFCDYVNVAIGESKEVKRKPSSDGIIKAVKELNKDIKNAIYAGDSEVDIQTAENVNIPCISVLWGFKSKNFLEQNGGKIFAQKPCDIINILENI